MHWYQMKLLGRAQTHSSDSQVCLPIRSPMCPNIWNRSAKAESSLAGRAARTPGFEQRRRGHDVGTAGISALQTRFRACPYWHKGLPHQIDVQAAASFGCQGDYGEIGVHKRIIS